MLTIPQLTEIEQKLAGDSAMRLRREAALLRQELEKVHEIPLAGKPRSTVDGLGCSPHTECLQIGIRVNHV